MPLARHRNDSAAATGTHHFGSTRRLRRPAEFAAVLGAPRAQSFRAARHWLSMTAAWATSDTAAVRFGATVGKRNARRAVDRAIVKRTLREAGRQAAPRLEAVCAERAIRLDIAFRLKSARVVSRDDQPSLAEWRRALRLEADALLDRLAARVQGTIA